MARLENTDEVAVLAADLRKFARALNAAYGQSAAWDILNQYRNMDATPRESNLSKALKAAHNRALGYIEEAEKETPIGDVEDLDGDA
jgi:hypothetical protein